MAYGDHRPIFQHCGYQTGQYGGTHRGKKFAHAINSIIINFNMPADNYYA